MKKVVTLLNIIGGLLLAGSLYAQQPGHYSLYFMNKLHWNPAYAGLDNSLSITAGFRKQWVGLAGSPTSQNLTMHMPLYIANGGIGISVDNDQFGAERATSANLAYNYQMEIGSGILSIGLAGGIVQRAIDGSQLRTPQGIYSEPGVINHNDDILPLINETAIVPSFDAGVYYQSEWLEIGLSAKNLLEGQAELPSFNLQLIRNYFGIVAFNFELGRSLTFHPSVFARSDFRQLQLDFSGIFRYNGNIFAGATFRGYTATSIDAVAITLGFKLGEKLTIGYAYDLTLSELNLVSNGSHEIMVNYNLNKPIGQGRPPRIIYNPRSL